jgi:hypothetical protein
LIEAPRLGAVSAYRHVAPLARSAAAFVEEEPVTVVGFADSHSVELSRREKLYSRAKNRSEHPVESLRVLFPRELVDGARAENGTSINGWKRVPKSVERGFRAAGEDGEKRLPEQPRAGERPARSCGFSFGTRKERPLLPGGEDPALPRPTGEVGIGLEKVLRSVRRPVVHGVHEVETEAPSAQVENASSFH